MNRVAEKAGALGLFTTANALAEAKLDPDAAPRDPRLVEPVACDIKRIFGQMTRRGHDPALVAALWAKLRDRPLERALVAVDVLASTLWLPTDPLLAEFRTAAATLGAARSKRGDVGINLNAYSATALMTKHAHNVALAASSTADLLALSYDHHLGAFSELQRRNDSLLTQEPTRESIHAFARLAALAHLPTLASIYLDFLVRGLGWRKAAPDLCEVYFDAGVAQKIPASAIEPGDIPERERRDVVEYLVYRSHIGVGDLDTANAALVQNSAQRGRWAGAHSVRLDVVRAHLGTLYNHSHEISLTRVETACDKDRTWRYGAKVRAIVAAKQHPLRATELFHAYVGGFGNDHDTAFTVISIGPERLKRDVAQILVREAFYLPHEPAVWKLLGQLFGKATSIAKEIDARLATQTA